MWTVIRWLLQLVGVHFPKRPHFSTVSATIDTLPVSNRRKFLVGGVLHLFLVVVSLTYLFVARFKEMHFTSIELLTLVLAVQWCWIGPGLIWLYEKRTLRRFQNYCRRTLANKVDYIDVRSAITRNVLLYKGNKYILATWILAVLTGFCFASKYLAAFAIRPPSFVDGSVDWFWFLTFIGAALFAYYTGLGFCLSYKAARIIRTLSKQELKESTYNKDGMMGFSYIGTFSFSTNAMFLSGFLFVPMIFVASSESGRTNYIFIGVMIALYITFSIATVIHSIWTIHSKMVKDKAMILNRYGTVLDGTLREFKSDPSDEAYRRFAVYRGLVTDIRATSDWPLRLNTAVTFAFTNFVLPGLVTLLSNRLATGG